MKKIWLKNYQYGVPETIDPERYQSLSHFFTHVCEKYAELPALTNFGETLTYQEFYKASEAFASFIQHELNMQHGDRLALMMPNCLQYPIAVFGCFLAGVTVVNVNPLYTVGEFTHQMQDSGAKAILVLANFARTVAKALPDTPLEHVIVTELGDMLPWPKRSIFNWVVRHVKKMVPAYEIERVIGFRHALAQGKQCSLRKVEIHGDDIAFLQYTGGTTGRAKGAMLTHRNLIANIEQAYAWIKNALTDGKEIIITALPLYHVFSLTANLLTFMRIGALNVLITNPRDLPSLVRAMEEVPFTAITGVNTLYNALLSNQAFSKLNFSTLKTALGGGMAVQLAVAERWQAITGTVLLEAYGLTETSPAVLINPMNTTEFTGYAGLPIPSTEVSIRNSDGEEVATGERGELCVRGPQVMKGYWQHPEETEKAFFPGGWFRTGDVAVMNEDGFVKIVDRIKDMIVVSGFNVYPNEVEDIIARHPNVTEVGVVGVPHKRGGEVVKAFVVLNDKGVTKAEIEAYCREHLTSYKVPKWVEFVDELPKTNVGKILRRALRDNTAA